MPQRQSPFLEGKYGWNYGESGWNSGMDENMLKFSFMFDGNVNGIVSSLPSVVNGESYFNSTENRLYFGVNNIWYSSPCPKHFIFKIRATGEFYQFDGTAAVKVDNPSELNTRLEAVELTLSQLGTAAFEDVDAFATQAELDVVEGQAQSYTDALRDDLANDTDPALGAGLVANSVTTLNTVADMVARSGWQIGQRVCTLGYYAPGDGGDNRYVIVPDGTGTVDGGLYIQLTGARAQAIFPGRKVYTKQFGTDGSPAGLSQQNPIQAALGNILTDDTANAWGADVQLTQGRYNLTAHISLGGDRTLRGTGGQNTTKVRAGDDYVGTGPIIRTSGAFSKIENLGISTSPGLYDPVAGTGTQTTGILTDSSNVFGNVVRDFRISNGYKAIDVATGLETKIHDGFIINSRIGIDITAWDTEVHSTIVQDNFIGVRTSHGIEANQLHIVRSSSIGLDVFNNGTPVHLNGLFLDTPYAIGARLRDMRGANFTNTYLLKIGDNANANAAGFKLETNSSQNNFIGGTVVNEGDNFLSVFQIDSGCVNNFIAGFRAPSKFANSAARMREQTVVGCHSNAARYNNVPRKNRQTSGNVAAGATAAMSFQLDYDFSALTFNTVLLYGKWVGRNGSSQSAFGDIYIPVKFSDTGANPVVTKISGHANISWSVTNVSLSGNVLTVTVQNDGTASSTLSVELEKSLDATGASF